MYRIRFHGRGGQGMKTAGRLLGSAFFAEGFEVQDAPRYGAERRGAPLFATVRAARRPIFERGPISTPDLAVVADESLLGMPAAGVLAGLGRHSLLVVLGDGSEDAWRERLRLPGDLLVLPAEIDAGSPRHRLGVACAAAAARLVGVIGWAALAEALREELGELGAAAFSESEACARATFERFESHAGRVVEGAETSLDALPAADWIDFPFEPARVAAPDVHAVATSVQVRTGLWRTRRPVVEAARCHHCTWICGSLCPDGAIQPGEGGVAEIDYDHCKGCLVCVAVCPSHAIHVVAEHDAAREEQTEVPA